MKNINAKVIVGMFAVAAFTGCSNQSRVYPSFMEDGEQGRFEMSGDAAGMREFGTVMAGVIREGKAPDAAATTPYWNHRMDQERSETIRKVAKTNKDHPEILKLFKDFLFPKTNPSTSNGEVPLLPSEQVNPAGFIK